MELWGPGEGVRDVLMGTGSDGEAGVSTVIRVWGGGNAEGKSMGQGRPVSAGASPGFLWPQNPS